RVLILTYSKPLARDLQRMHKSKTRDQDHAYESKIAIDYIQSLMEETIINKALGKKEAEIWRKKAKQDLKIPEDYLEYALPEKCQDILKEHTMQYRWFDYLLIDE